MAIFLNRRFLETAISDFVNFCAIKAVAKLTILSSSKLDARDISYISSKAEKSIILIGKTILKYYRKIGC